MAVIDQYINANIIAGKKPIAYTFSGDGTMSVTAIVNVAAADDNGSKYRLFRIGAQMIPIEAWVSNDAITGGTDYDIGLYHPLNGSQGGVVRVVDCLAAALDLSSGHTEDTRISGLNNVALADSHKRLWELATDTEFDNEGEYDVVLTANTVGSGAGVVVVKFKFAQG